MSIEAPLAARPVPPRVTRLPWRAPAEAVPIAEPSPAGQSSRLLFLVLALALIAIGVTA